MEIGELDKLEVHRAAVSRSTRQVLLCRVALGGLVEEIKSVTLTHKKKKKEREGGTEGQQTTPNEQTMARPSE